MKARNNLKFSSNEIHKYDNVFFKAFKFEEILK